jgi:hypothetical protein
MAGLTPHDLGEPIGISLSVIRISRSEFGGGTVLARPRAQVAAAGRGDLRPRRPDAREVRQEKNHDDADEGVSCQ